MRFAFCPILLFAILLFTSCKNEVEEFKITQPLEFIALAPGKFITYRLDSLVFVQQGRTEETHYYQEKHEVDAEVVDGLGRKSFRIFRYLRDTAALKAWSPAGTYLITPLNGTLEVIEDNLRVLKLVAPLKEGASWKGNHFLGPNPYSSKYTFFNDDDLDDWNFTVTSTGETINIYGKSYSDVITIKSFDESQNVPVTDPRSFATRSLQTEKYAKGIGMISQDFILWEYQPSTSGGTTGTKTGFGVKRRIINHN
jgi:hypothetical protein